MKTFGYWIGWSVVLSINGLVAGTLIQAEWFSKNTWTKSGAGFDLSLPIAIGIGIEVVATFAPEYHDTQRDTPKALRSAALFSVAV